MKMANTFADLVNFPGHLGPAPSGTMDTHGTTVIALRFDGGILNLGDRRATVSNYIMYDRAEKVLKLDDHTLVAISGSFARSVEIVRFLKHAFKYYARSQMQDMSLEGKLMEVSRALSGNLSMALEGIGIFIPIISAFDVITGDFSIYNYDAMGARFESENFAAAGSGSERIRGVFEYISRRKGAFEKRPLDEVLADGLDMLDIAAQLDSATGGFDRTPPVAKLLTAAGVTDVLPEVLQAATTKVSGSRG